MTIISGLRCDNEILDQVKIIFFFAQSGLMMIDVIVHANLIKSKEILFIIIDGHRNRVKLIAYKNKVLHRSKFFKWNLIQDKSEYAFFISNARCSTNAKFKNKRIKNSSKLLFHFHSMIPIK